jgi:hypothetical protein
MITKEELSKRVKKKMEEEEVLPENNLKQLFLDYVGGIHNPEDGKITVEMIVSVMADEFPEFMLVMAEQNFTQGYKQALSDVERYNNQRKKAEK